MKREQLLDGVAQLRQRIRLEAALREPLEHAPLGARRPRAHFAPGVGEKPERPPGRDAGIELPQGAGGRVAWVCEHGPAGPRLLLVEREERGAAHVDLAAYLTDLRQAAAAAQPVGNV